jgi:serine/threonine protein kinase
MGAEIGAVIAGYRIDALLGHGGMSVVYVAEQPRLRQKRALKILSPRARSALRCKSKQRRA